MLTFEERQMRTEVERDRRTGPGLALLALSVGLLLGVNVHAQGVAALSCSPSSISGGSGGSATCTVTLGAPAPAGGTAVALSSSLVELAASVPSVTVLAGQTTAPFTVTTNANYRRYSLLAFAPIITASANATSQSATLNVTAQPRPPDFPTSEPAPSSQPLGVLCGGINIGGEMGILYECTVPNVGFGTCVFRQECSIGCRTNGSGADFCAASGPNPISVARNLITSGDRVAASVVAEAAAASTPTTRGHPLTSFTTNAGLAPTNGGLVFPAGSASVGFDVHTSYAPTIDFVNVAGYWFTGTNQGRAGNAWIAMVPPSPPPALPIPTLMRLSTDGAQVNGISVSGFSTGGGPTIELTSNRPDIVLGPASVVVNSSQANGNQVNFSTQRPSVATDVTITATDGRYSSTGILTVQPPPPPPAPQPLTLSVVPNSVAGGGSATGTLTITFNPFGTDVTLRSSNTAVATVPATVTIPAGTFTANFSIATSAVAASASAIITATCCNLTVSAPIEVTSGAALPAPPLLLAVSPASVIGGNTTTGSVTLNAAAPAGGTLVKLSSSRAAATVPLSVTVPAAATSASFVIATNSVTALTATTIAAVSGSQVSNAVLAINPPGGSALSLAGIMLNPATVPAGTSARGTVTLNAPAPAGGAVVALSSSRADALVPASVTVPAGATSASFTVTTNAAGGSTISALFAGVQRVAELVTTVPVDPNAALATFTLDQSSAVGGSVVNGSVTLTGPAPSSGAGGAQIVMTSSNTTVVPVNTGIVVGTGATSAAFSLVPHTVSASTNVTITMSFGGVTLSRVLTVNPSAPPTPAAPTLVSPAASATPAQPVTFDWSDVANAVSYEIQIDDTSTIAAPFRVNQAGIIASQATIGGLPAQRLWWRVRAQNSAGVFGPFSATRRFTPQAASAPASLSGLSVNPTSVVGGSASTGTATLTAAAPTGGALVALTSGNPAAGVPASVTIAAGATSATFSVTTSAVTANTAVTLTGTYNGTSRTSTLTVTPVPPPASLNALVLNPTSVTGGAASQATVTLTSAAPVGGSLVALSSNSAAASVPGSVTVPAGATSAAFTASTSAVTAVTSATISAILGGVTRSAALTVNPPGTNVTLTVTATGRSGERVVSSPAGINVTVGSSGTAPFASNTSVTLSVANGRDAIWSGACSSGGNKAKTCTFTITANASVTGNVQ
jgi:trimeric autotransporter adhesin